jgi:hypothetical protein
MLRSGIRRLWQPRYGKRVALGLLGAVVIYGLLGFFLVPWIIGEQIRSQARARLNREARVDETRFNPFTLAATIKGFTLLDSDGADLLKFDLLYVDLQLSGFFRRALRFREVRLDRPVLSARILADGRPSVADLMEPAPGGAPDAAPFQLPRLIVDRLSINAGVAQFTDASLQPPYQSRFEPLDVGVHNLVTIPTEGGEHTITIGVEDGAIVRWTGQQMVDPLRFAGRVDITGLPIRRLWDYFGQGQPLEIHDGRVDVSLPYTLERGSDKRVHLSLQDGSAIIRALAARPRGEPLDVLTVPELRVDGVNAAWPEARFDVATLRILRPSAQALVEKDGAWNWSRAFKQDSAAPAAPSSSSSASPNWQFRVGSAELEGGAIHFEDTHSAPPARLDLTEFAARATNLSSNLAAMVPLTLSGRVLEKGAIEVSGAIAPSPMAANLKISARGIDLGPWRSYIRDASGAPINKGIAGVEGQLTLSGDKQALRFAADAALDDIELLEPNGGRLAAWRKLQISGLTLETPPGRARVRKITIDEPFAKILIEKNGRLNLMNAAAGPAPAKPAPANSTAPMTVEVGTVELRGASAEFEDETLLVPFVAKIHSAGGAIRDLSSFASAPATLAVEGRVDETGHVKTNGTLRIANPMASSEVNVSFRSIEMVDLTPYFAKFAGYSVKSGVLDLDVKYIVKDRRLIGNHTLSARDLVLGERVKDSKAPGLPIRLAVALLKDKEGRINMDVPIEGAVDNPEFDYSAVFWSALRTIMGNAAKAPFRAMGRLFGRDEEDLELVDFDTGRSDLLPAEADKLARLAEQIGPRRELTLAIEGRFEAAGDRAALKQSKMERLIESRRESAAAAAAATGAATLETILETLFTEQFTAPGLAAERQRFTATSGPEPVFDAAAFYEALRARLLESQQVSDAELETLATARAQTIRQALTSAGVIESTRVSVTPPGTAKRKKAGSARVASEITMSAEGETEEP